MQKYTLDLEQLPICEVGTEGQEKASVGGSIHTYEVEHSRKTKEKEKNNTYEDNPCSVISTSSPSSSIVKHPSSKLSWPTNNHIWVQMICLLPKQNAEARVDVEVDAIAG